MIARARESLGWTQDHLAAAVGIKRSMLADFESGRRRMSDEVAARIEAVFADAVALRPPPPGAPNIAGPATAATTSAASGWRVARTADVPSSGSKGDRCCSNKGLQMACRFVRKIRQSRREFGRGDLRKILIVSAAIVLMTTLDVAVYIHYFGRDDPVFDASTEQTSKQSIATMQEGLDAADREELGDAVKLVCGPAILGATYRATFEHGAHRPTAVDVFKPLHGMTRAMIIARAEAIRAGGP